MNRELRHPTVFDGPILAWNWILLGWDRMPYSQCLSPRSIWPEWIRVRDGKRFDTPPDDMVWEQPKEGTVKV